MIKITVTMNAASGLHARPANMFTKTASQFKSTITVEKDDKQADGKRLLAIMALGVKQGDQMTIIAEGEDEQEAIKVLEKMLADDFQ